MDMERGYLVGNSEPESSLKTDIALTARLEEVKTQLYSVF
jgi:hypothetical protein